MPSELLLILSVKECVIIAEITGPARKNRMPKDRNTASMPLIHSNLHTCSYGKTLIFPVLLLVDAAHRCAAVY